MKNSKRALWVLLADCVICLIGRIYQIVGCTDMTSGFLYFEDGIGAKLVYYLPLVLVLAGAVAAAISDRKSGTLAAADVSDMVDGKAAVIGFGMLITGICAVYSGLEKMDATYCIPLSMYIDFIFGAAMVVVAFITLYKKEFSAGLGFSYVVGSVYFMFRGIMVFLERMVIATVPEYLIDTLIAIFAACFFMLFTKLFSGNGQKNTRAALCVVGTCTAVLSLSSAIATIAAKFIAPEEISSRIAYTRAAADFYYQSRGGKDAYMLTFTPWVNVAVGLMAAATVIVLLFKKKAEKAENSPE